MTLLFFIYGIVFGSFFNVVGLRVPKKESIVSPPSHCTSCDRKLGVLDLDTGFLLPIPEREMPGMRLENQSDLSVHGVRNGWALCAVVLYARIFSVELIVATIICVASCHHHGIRYRVYAYSE